MLAHYCRQVTGTVIGGTQAKAVDGTLQVFFVNFVFCSVLRFVLVLYYRGCVTWCLVLCDTGASWRSRCGRGWSERPARAIRGASCGGPCGSLVRTTSPRNQRRQLRRPLWEPGQNDQPAQSEAPVAEAPVGAWSERLARAIRGASCGGPCGRGWSERPARAIRGASCGAPCGREAGQND
ncbi:hypothetical protein JB92DRAFT_10005 [Gautieria morchelliformis]|nr:hypothetical protein JB92DRAFT_10005 [Gautieria morchelliformis]